MKRSTSDRVYELVTRTPRPSVRPSRFGASIRVGISAAVVALVLGGCAGAPSSVPASSAPAGSPTVAPKPTPTPTPDPILAAFRASIADPAFSANGDIRGTITLDGDSAAPVDVVTGSIAWAGPDVAQEIRIDRPGPATRTAYLGRWSRTMEIDGQGYVAICVFIVCGPDDPTLWTAVDPAVAPMPGPPLSIPGLLRARTDVAQAGEEVVAGEPLARLVLTEPVAEGSALGWAAAFGGSSLGRPSGRLEVLVDADGRPRVIRIGLVVAGLSAAQPAAWVELEVDLSNEGPATVAPPDPGTVLAFVASTNGYALPVLSDWTFVPGDPFAGGAVVDRFVAPDGAPRRELRVHLDMGDAAMFDIDAAGNHVGGTTLRDWARATYGATIPGITGGFGGVINVESTTFDTVIDGVPTTVIAGPRYWGGPGTCATDDLACTNRWSMLELWSDPDPDDLDAQNLSYKLIDLAAGMFLELDAGG